MTFTDPISGEHGQTQTVGDLCRGGDQRKSDRCGACRRRGASHHWPSHRCAGSALGRQAAVAHHPAHQPDRRGQRLSRRLPAPAGRAAERRGQRERGRSEGQRPSAHHRAGGFWPPPHRAADSRVSRPASRGESVARPDRSSGRSGQRGLRLRRARGRSGRFFAGQPAAGRQPARVRGRAQLSATSRHSGHTVRSRPSPMSGVFIREQPAARLDVPGRGRDPACARGGSHGLHRWRRAAPVVSRRPGHRLAFAVGSGRQSGARQARGASRRLCRAAQRHLRGLHPAQASAPAAAPLAGLFKTPFHPAAAGAGVKPRIKPAAPAGCR